MGLPLQWRTMSDAARRDELLLANRALLVLHSSRTAAHELNNVFQMIGGAAELLLANPALAPALVPRAESLVRHVRRGEAIVRSMAELARPEGPGPSTVDLASLTTQALDMRRFEHRRAGIAVVAEMGPGILVQADPRDLVQILLNMILCAEAAVAKRPDGTIAVTIERQRGDADVVVVDNGAAVPVLTFDLAAARALAETAGGSVERSDNRTRLRLPVAGVRADRM
jgi:signal transduction histidine kinase